MKKKLSYDSESKSNSKKYWCIFFVCVAKLITSKAERQVTTRKIFATQIPIKSQQLKNWGKKTKNCLEKWSKDRNIHFTETETNKKSFYTWEKICNLNNNKIYKLKVCWFINFHLSDWKISKILTTYSVDETVREIDILAIKYLFARNTTLEVNLVTY